MAYEISHQVSITHALHWDDELVLSSLIWWLWEIGSDFLKHCCTETWGYIAGSVGRTSKVNWYSSCWWLMLDRGGEGWATSWPHWRKQCFPILPKTRIIEDLLKTQIVRSGTNPQHLQDRYLGNGIFNNCPRRVSFPGKSGKHWDRHSLSCLHFQALWIKFLKFSWLNFILTDQPLL